MTHLHLDPDARSGLRMLSERLRTGKSGVGMAAPTVAARVSQAPTRVLPLEEFAAEEVVLRPAAPAPHLVIDGASRAEKLASLRRQAEAWLPARALGSLRDVLVFATGNPEARIMLIGEAPGYEEERKREPFSGPAGQKLDGILQAMGLQRNEVYLSNLVKFRPATARQSTNSRPATSAEIAACLPLLREEIAIVGPQCIVTLGGSVADALLGSGGDVPALRGAWHDFAGVPVRVTYHPSQLLLAAYDQQIRRLLWEDMLAVMERCELPISDKQRGFFLPKN
ncbi:MAG: uracil-DNA glycosylase [Verrucomicrobia bacterium]|nr:MAG: uracil-DNA glycosylase [Verrucomicrobiota bacterium]